MHTIKQSIELLLSGMTYFNLLCLTEVTTIEKLLNIIKQLYNTLLVSQIKATFNSSNQFFKHLRSKETEPTKVRLWLAVILLKIG